MSACPWLLHQELECSVDSLGHSLKPLLRVSSLSVSPVNAAGHS